MLSRPALTLSPLLVLVLALNACGERDDPAIIEPGAQGQPADQGTIPEPMRAFEDDGNVLELVIESDDAMRFDIDRFTVEPGQMVRLTLEHVGNLPAQAMGHNVVILVQGEDVFDFGEDVGEQGGGMHDEFVPDVLRDRVIAFTAMIGGGETATVEFQAPEEPGEYPFLCSFPGHTGQMNGVMVVE